jgi:fatty acid desaturase
MTMISRHALLTTRLLLETVGLFALLAVLAMRVTSSDWAWLYPSLLLAQAFTLQRIYIVGHEAAHKKLVPSNRHWNDALGQIMLMPILVPVVIYRKVHYFHHGFNRKDHHHSALDVFVSPWPVTLVVRGFFYQMRPRDLKFRLPSSSRLSDFQH